MKIVSIFPFPEDASYLEIEDDNGYIWIYSEDDTPQLWCSGTEAGSGYVCYSASEAIEILHSGGFVEDNPIR
jgi:hypothetical protein